MLEIWYYSQNYSQNYYVFSKLFCDHIIKPGISPIDVPLKYSCSRNNYKMYQSGTVFALLATT